MSQAQRFASAILVSTACWFTACEFRTPAPETPARQTKGDMIQKSFFFKDRKFKSGKCSDQVFLASWAALDERGYFAERYLNSGVPERAHLNIQWCFTERALLGYKVNPSFKNQFEKSTVVIEIPIARNYYLEAERDRFQRDTNKIIKNSERSAWMHQPMMDLDFQGIRVNDWAYGILDDNPQALDVTGIEWDPARQFLGFTVLVKDNWAPGGAQSRFRFNFMGIETKPEDQFPKRPYDASVSKHINVLHVLGRTLEGSEPEAYAGRWDVSQPVTFYTHGVPDKYMDIVQDVIDGWNDAFVQAGVKRPGEKALLLSRDPIPYAFDLRYPVINWNDDTRQSLNAPLGIGIASGDVQTGEFKYGSVSVWSGIMEKYVNKFAIAETAYAGAMGLGGAGQARLNRSTLVDPAQFAKSLQPFLGDGGIEGFLRSPEALDKLRRSLRALGQSNDWISPIVREKQPEIAEKMKESVADVEENVLNADNYASFLHEDLMLGSQGPTLFDALAVFHEQFSSSLFDAPEAVRKELNQSRMDQAQEERLTLQLAQKDIYERAYSDLQDADRTYADVLPELIQAMRESDLSETEILRSELKNLVMHELGHVLGLGHNFKGNILPPKGSIADSRYDLLNRQRREKGYVASTVMDYYNPRMEARMRYEDVKPGPYDIDMLRYLYLGQYPATTADGKDVKYLDVPGNGVIPDRPLDPQTGEALRTGFYPACNDIEASTNVDPFCNRFDRGSDATDIMISRFKDFNSGLMSQLNAFSSARGGNAELKKFYLWYRVLTEFGQIRVFYDYMRLLLDDDPRYQDAFKHISGKQDSLIAFADACIDPNRAPDGYRQDFATLALRDPAKLGTPTDELAPEDYTEIHDLCVANKIALDQFLEITKRKGSDYTTYDRLNRFVPSGMRGGDVNLDWGYIWGAYRELGAFPVRMSTLMTVTNPFPYFIWGGLAPVPLYSNIQGRYSYAPLYPREFGLILDATVSENLNLGGGALGENTEIGSTLMYTSYFLMRNRTLSKDNDNRFPTTYLENLAGLTSFDVRLSPLILTNVTKEGTRDSLVFSYAASYLDMAKYESVAIPFAFLLPERRVVAQGNEKQIFLPISRFRYLTDKWGYVWALDLRYYRKSDDPLKGFSVTYGLDKAAQQQIERCAQGSTGLSSFFSITNEKFEGFEVGTGIASKPDLQDRFDETLKNQFDKYYASDFGGRKPNPLACDETIKSLNLIVGGAALLNGYWLPQAVQYLNF